jgi:hypothetical protein
MKAPLNAYSSSFSSLPCTGVWNLFSAAPFAMSFVFLPHQNQTKPTQTQRSIDESSRPHHLPFLLCASYLPLSTKE